MIISFTVEELNQCINDRNTYGLSQTGNKTDKLSKLSNWELTKIIKQTNTTPIFIIV